MKLIQIGKKREWQVLAVCDDNEDCQVLDHIMANKALNRLWEKMLSRLMLVIPEKGPQFGVNTRKSEHYEKGIGAFKENRNRGPKARVYFFRDDQTLICTEAFDKRNEKIDQFITRAEQIKLRYEQAKRRGEIEIQSLK